MKDLSVFISALEKVRFETLSVSSSISDFEVDSEPYKLLALINSACNELSSIIDVMEMLNK